MKYKYSELLIAREGLYRSKSGFEDKILADDSRYSRVDWHGKFSFGHQRCD